MEGRKEYLLRALNREELASDPSDQLAKWLREAAEAGAIEPNAMCLSTVSNQGRPSSRFVLLRGLDERGLMFNTNFESRKANELDGNPWACAAFWWGECERQVRVEGRVVKASEEECDRYFGQRPRSSQISAWASPQSTVIESRDFLEEQLREFEAQFPDKVPRPPNWGAFRLNSEMYEFWQGREARLHDRFRYRKDGQGWIIERLAP